MPRTPIQVSIFVAPSTEVGEAVRLRASRPARTRRGVIVATVCLLGHALLLRHMMLSAGSPPPPERFAPAKISVVSETDQDSLQWITVDPNALFEPRKERQDLPSARLRQMDIPKQLKVAALLVEDLDLPPTPDATVADAGRLSKLYGRYVTQISARIERAWLRPRTPIGAPSFSCQARISQDVDGNVLEVALAQCNGDARWQLSLIQAIQSASPLPAPPDPDVFSRTLHIAFSAEGYSAERLPDEYESSASAQAFLVAQDSQHADAVLQDMASHRETGTVELTITGDHKSVTVNDSAHEP